ncbi:MAG: AraC family transcriptional regulator [Planctomycetota bacterium]
MSIVAHHYFQYLPVSERDRDWDLYVDGLGWAGEPPGTTYAHSLHPEPYCFAWDRGRVLADFAALYITQGQGEFESEITGRTTVPPGKVILLFPGVWHRYRPGAESGWTKYSVAFGGGYAQRLLERQFISPERPILDTGLDDSILHGYLRLLDLLQSRPNGLQPRLAAHVMEILAAALAAAGRGRELGTLHDAVRRAKLLLEQHVEDLVDMKQLAASLHLSYDRFRHLFAMQTRMSPYQYHLQLRINRAKQLLHGTALSVKEIAATLKFEDPHHFSKIFKKHAGISATQWHGNAGRKGCR